MSQGRVQAIYICPDSRAAPVAIESARAVPGRGIEGDRYFNAAGTFPDTDKDGRHDTGREITLIEAEAIAAAGEQTGQPLGGGAHRRNIVTSGVALNDLVGREFTVGPVRVRGIRLCHPCGHLETVSGVQGAEQSLTNRGGLRAQVLTEGTIRTGDSIETTPTV